MRIDINNYEVWMLDYLDGNLDELQSKEVEAFLLMHPHIAEEFEGLAQIELTANKEILLNSSFKKDLIKKDIIATKNIKPSNYQLIFAAFYEGDLDKLQNEELNHFLEKNDFLINEFKQFKNTKIKADTSITFPKKEMIYKKENTIIPLWMWSSIAAAILLIGFWLAIPNSDIRPSYLPERIQTKTINSLKLATASNELPVNTRSLETEINLDNLEEPSFERNEIPMIVSSIPLSSLEIKENNWSIQMELMQSYAFKRNQLKTQVDWAAIPSENSKKGFRLISSFLWKTTKAQVQSFGEDVFSNDIQAITSNNLENITGGVISIKRPSKEKE